MGTLYSPDRAAPFNGIDEWSLTEQGAQWFAEVKAQDPVFQGHYPGNPILPGIYTFEACCQGIELYFAHQEQRAKVLQVRTMRFQAAFTPGCMMKIQANISSLDSEGICDVRFLILRDGEKAASAKIQFKVESGKC